MHVRKGPDPGGNLSVETRLSVRQLRLRNPGQPSSRFLSDVSRECDVLVASARAADSAQPRHDRGRVRAGSAMQSRPIGELLNVAVQRQALDQLEVEVARTLEDPLPSGLTGQD